MRCANAGGRVGGVGVQLWKAEQQQHAAASPDDDGQSPGKLQNPPRGVLGWQNQNRHWRKPRCDDDSRRAAAAAAVCDTVCRVYRTSKRRTAHTRPLEARNSEPGPGHQTQID